MFLLPDTFNDDESSDSEGDEQQSSESEEEEEEEEGSKDKKVRESVDSLYTHYQGFWSRSNMYLLILLLLKPVMIMSPLILKVMSSGRLTLNRSLNRRGYTLTKIHSTKRR